MPGVRNCFRFVRSITNGLPQTGLLVAYTRRGLQIAEQKPVRLDGSHSPLGSTAVVAPEAASSRKLAMAALWLRPGLARSQLQA